MVVKTTTIHLMLSIPTTASLATAKAGRTALAIAARIKNVVQFAPNVRRLWMLDGFKEAVKNFDDWQDGL